MTTVAKSSRTSTASPARKPATNQALADDDSAQTYAANRSSVDSAYVLMVGNHWKPNGVVANSTTAITARRRDDHRRSTCQYTMQPSATVNATERLRSRYQDSPKIRSQVP